jgi:hypothetical protein
MAVDSQRWKCVEAVPTFLFSIDGLSAVRAREPARRGWLTVAEGTVADVDDLHVVLEDDVSLALVLPAAIDLRPLRGTYVKLALADEPSASGPRAQTLVIADATGRTRLTARFGPAGQAHTVGGSRVRTALSQRPNGPMAFGTERLQYVVQVGEHVRVREAAGEYVLHFVARTAIDYVAYAIAEKTFWISGRR